MDFSQAIRSCFSKYATFSGRAQRSEFWFFSLFTLLGSIALSILDSLSFGLSLADPGLLEGLFSLAMLLPSLSVTVRRLHDLDRTGWWLWLWLIPVIGWIILLIWMVSKGTDGDNDYGPDPLDGFSVTDTRGGFRKSSIPRVPRKD